MQQEASTALTWLHNALITDVQPNQRFGNWVGGIPVLGYDVAFQGGKLVVNGAEAQQVRNIFGLYLVGKSEVVDDRT